jgi:hypothetical protein
MLLHGSCFTHTFRLSCCVLLLRSAATPPWLILQAVCTLLHQLHMGWSTLHAGLQQLPWEDQERLQPLQQLLGPDELGPEHAAAAAQQDEADM